VAWGNVIHYGPDMVIATNAGISQFRYFTYVSKYTPCENVRTVINISTLLRTPCMRGVFISTSFTEFCTKRGDGSYKSIGTSFDAANVMIINLCVCACVQSLILCLFS
jgi:hypothetical protein